MFLTRGYRVGDWSAPRGITAGAVVRYERDELCNDMGISEEVITMLDTIPSGELLWVTATRKDARRYGTDIEVIDFSAPVLVLSEDGDGGMLVLLATDEITQQVAHLLEQQTA